jgi:phosphoribosylanthranilate isomerase
MHRTRIKICGIRTPEIALAAVEAGADAIGLNFVEKSPRFVTVEEAQRVVHALPAFVEPVALFADATPAHVRRICSETGIRTVQLHGQEPPTAAEAVLPARVIKVLHIGDGAAAQVRAWSGVLNLTAIMWDTPPQGAELTGGSGRTFAWNDLAQLQQTDALRGLRLIVAGGLTAENVGDAVRLLRPYAVDVSSGVESSCGVKDHVKIRAFCEAVRAADAAE